MKGFVRKEPLFSLCGLNCGLCTMHLGGYCPGCGGGDGNQSCAIAKCSMQHGNIQCCFECREYPCPKYDKMDEYDSFIPRRGRQRDVERAQMMGVSAYIAELHEKMKILDWLLQNYNDGRRKTFFDTAVYRLELGDIQTVMESLENQDGILELPVKEKALIAVRLFQDLADKRGISLKLIKKPKTKKNEDNPL